ncbi:hypothetical protein F4809DRAFT_643264 [Biscogniauxia mediterranea]|nr:hypothetical protein F4809DRAFT_643264 [Biscogniauxia mediterranea]
MGADRDVRNALIRTYLALLQREIREKSHWYTTQRVVIRRRNGRIQLSRRGSRPSYAIQSGFVSIDGEIIQHDGFILIDDGDDPGSFLL